jgi:hypothetical protein
MNESPNVENTRALPWSSTITRPASRNSSPTLTMAVPVRNVASAARERRRNGGAPLLTVDGWAANPAYIAEDEGLMGVPL